MTYLEAEKAVEFEADGTLHRLGIYEPLELVSKEEWEASLPPHILEEAMQAAKEEAERLNPSTPGRSGQPQDPPRPAGRLQWEGPGPTCSLP